jgi:hypothetical protein
VNIRYGGARKDCLNWRLKTANGRRKDHVNLVFIRTMFTFD